MATWQGERHSPKMARKLAHPAAYFLRRGSLRVAATSGEFGVLAVESGGLLEGTGGLDDGGVISGAGDELKTDREIFLGKPAGNGEGGQAAEIADGPERIWEGKSGHEIQVERSGSDGLRSSNENIEGFKDRAHFSL